MSPKPVFICGVTGVQGGAVARVLLTQGVQVHAVTRNPSSDATREFTALGVKFWPGDFDNQEALKGAIAGCSSIYLNFYPDFADHGANLRQAQSIMSIALAAGANHVVYTSVLGANDLEGISTWDPNGAAAWVMTSKRDIEEAVKASGFPHWTILRPALFMTNFLGSNVAMYGNFAESGTWSTGLLENTPIPVISPKTMGAFGAAALLEPTKWHGREFDYADEFLTPGQVVQELARASGVDLKVHIYPEEELKALASQNPFVAGQLITREIHKFVDMEEVKAENIPLTPFREFLEGEKARAVATYSK